MIRLHLRRWQGLILACQEPHELATSADLAQEEENDYWRLWRKNAIVDEDIEVDSGSLKGLTGALDEEQRYECR